MTAEEFVLRLEGVKRSGEGWMAKCPAHEDRTASLSIGTGLDGRVLLRCFAECSVHAIVSAVGVELRDLFPPRLVHSAGPSRPPRHSPADMLRLLELEALVVVAAARVLKAGHPLSEVDAQRLALANERIAEIVSRGVA